MRGLALALALLVCADAAFAAPEDEPPRVELPLGAFLRPGRPLDVRVPGGADRVRATGTPWALPQGERGDEFILQLPASAGTVLSLEIERSGRVRRELLDVEAIPGDVVVAGIPAGGVAPAGARAVTVPITGRPTVREGWLVLDEVAEAVAPPGVADDLRSLRRWPSSKRELLEPLLLPPDAACFEAMSRIAASAPRLPAEVGVVAAVLAAAELVLLLVLRSRRAPPWHRTAWLGLPAVAAAAYLLLPDRLPGALSATAVAVDGPGRFVIVQVAARRAGSARFVLSPQVGSAAMVRFAADDATVNEAQAGREVLLELRPGEVRLFAYTFHSRPLGESTVTRLFAWEVQLPPVHETLRAWLESRGLEVTGDDEPFSRASLPRTEGTTVIAAASAFASAPTK